MERVGGVVKRVLKGINLVPEEKDYLSLWDEFVPAGIRKHTRVSVRNKVVYAATDNPTTSHLLSLYKERIIERFRESRLPIKKLVITQKRKRGGEN